MVSIAIDGPSGAGKSTLSRALAKKLGLLYVDTGAMYRAVGLAALRAGAPTKNADAVESLLPHTEVSLRHLGGAQQVFLNGEDVSKTIRAEEVSMAASDVSAHPAVRAFLLDTQRRLAKENDVIMDGRDIGTVVLPKAELKIFLTATAEDRAQRRYEELLAKGMQADYQKVLEDVKQRDYNDSHRAAAPLKKAEDAVELVTTGNSFEQSLEQLYALILQRLPQLGQGGKDG
ncbi:(d)CMP kinase [Ruminococcaceae bacterium OttesenSCG-928-I18]|nr:(d)CMP kinase [Ruminococcaceae bacterium OttesenSCG-928-I18]